jgi:hypothetical protein
MNCAQIDWNILIATLAFIVSTISLIISIRTTKDQTLTFILNQLDGRAAEANTVIAFNMPDLRQEFILSQIVSIIVSSEQLLAMLETKYSRQIKKKDKIFLREQFYLILHTSIRSQMWTIDESSIKNEIIRTQLKSAKSFLHNAHSKWD